MDNKMMRQVYLQTDIGIFPNRCEGGNNMVMCEYMACGRTVIASDATGHADVITPNNAFPLTTYEPIVHNDAHGQPSSIWHEAGVEEIIDMLENAYRNRGLCQQKAAIAAEDMKNLAWDKAARQFYCIANKVSATASFKNIR
jgi:glycosyltransferase involved in cell wall biosynthesis